MSITLDQVTKRYQGVPVVNDVSLDIGDGEFFVLLGPSGSGKSTLLRAIAGLTDVDHGLISLHGRDVTHVTARERGVGLVFQNYALFRHMTVADNIEFALRARGVKAAVRRSRRAELLRLVALEGMDDRLPSQLSGGQQQRVAVARALAHKPEVVLLDEPFGALDAKIREELRRTIRQVQRELGITTILVTHDQEEAFALADRIGVMNAGRLLEVGRPHDLYAAPTTRFVATFLGAANLLLARQSRDGIRFGNAPVSVPALAGSSERDHEVVAVLRPEEIEIAPRMDALVTSYIGHGTVTEIVFTGALERLRIEVSADTAHDAASPVDSDGARFEVTRTQHEQRAFPVQQGLRVALGVRRIHLLPTPLSSFTACAESEGSARELSRHPFLIELASRMKTRVGAHVAEAMGEISGGEGLSFGGAAVVAWRPSAAQEVEWLLRHGAQEVLLLPKDAADPERILIHSGDETSRHATLAVAASLLRHIAAEGVYVDVVANGTPDAQRAYGLRALLDTRSEAHATHGLELRTELQNGELTDALMRQLAARPHQMLVLGISDPAAVSGRFSQLLQTEPRSAMLIVYRAAQSARQPVRAAATMQ